MTNSTSVLASSCFFFLLSSLFSEVMSGEIGKFATCFGKALILIVMIVFIDENGLLLKGLFFLNYCFYSYKSLVMIVITYLPCVGSTAGTCGGSSLTTLGTNPSNSLHTVFTCICACEGCICLCVVSYLQEILHWKRKDKKWQKRKWKRKVEKV